MNNAGIGPNGEIEDITLEQYEKVISINQKSVFLGMKCIVPYMKKVEAGSIINIASLASFGGSTGTISYTASKFATRGMTKVAALEFAKYGIRVNSVHPGVIETPMIEASKEMIEANASSIPLGRLGTVEEASKLVLFLASDDSSYSTGSEFIFDGGSTASL